jgi:hypothetical protein
MTKKTTPKEKTRDELFADRLSDLLSEFSDVDANEVMSQLEMQLYALRESAGE